MLVRFFSAKPTDGGTSGWKACDVLEWRSSRKATQQQPVMILAAVFFILFLLDRERLLDGDDEYINLFVRALRARRAKIDQLQQKEHNVAPQERNHHRSVLPHHSRSSHDDVFCIRAMPAEFLFLLLLLFVDLLVGVCFYEVLVLLGTIVPVAFFRGCFWRERLYFVW